MTMLHGYFNLKSQMKMQTKQITKRTVVSGLIFFLGLFFTSATAEVKLPTILSSNMVLQRNIPVNIWGWAKPGEKVSVLFNEQNMSTVTLTDSTWKVLLKPMKAGGSFDMEIKGENTITLSNILIGDVWICAGQSNMDLPLIEAKNGGKEVSSGLKITVNAIGTDGQSGSAIKAIKVTSRNSLNIEKPQI
jgi:hypothetical protein